VYVSTAATSGVGLIGNDDTTSADTGETAIYRNSSNFGGRSRNGIVPFSTSVPSTTPGLIGLSRSGSSGITFRGGNISSSITLASAGTASSGINLAVFSRDLANASSRSNARLAFYSIGEAVNLELLDARVTRLVCAFAQAIP
jgi:hypothetical protein